MNSIDKPPAAAPVAIMSRPVTLARLMVLLLAGGAAPAWSLGFGAAPNTAVLGAPLEFSVPIRLDPAESLDAACVAATVTSGQNLVAPETVEVTLSGQGSQRTLRVTTARAITEPLVTISVTAGCAARVTRRFTLFADPPGHRIIPLPEPPSVQALAQAAAQRAQAVAPPSAAPAGAAGGDVAPGSGLAASSAPPAITVAPATPPVALKPAPSTGATTASPSTGAASATPPTALGAAPPGASPEGAADAELAMRAPPSRVVSKWRLRSRDGSSALKLDAAALSPQIVADAARAERDAALRAAEEAADAAQSAQQRAEALERSVALLQQQLTAQREAMERLTLALRDTQQGTPPWPWMAALAAMGLWALWLLVRLRRTREQQLGLWREQAALAPLEEAPVQAEGPAVGSGSLVSQGVARAAVDPADVRAPAAAGRGARERRERWDGDPLAPVAAASPSGGPREIPPLGGEPPPLETAPPGGPPTMAAPWPQPPQDVQGRAVAAEAFPSGRGDAGVAATVAMMPAAPVVVGDGMSASAAMEALLDLDQQVEFFAVLGQDEVAAGLLADHVRAESGVHPLPFLKLIEIHRRAGDEEALEDVRAAFEARFGVPAPAWDDGAGRPLDEEPQALAELQAAWSRPEDAMALLEALQRPPRAGTALGMAALSDALFLYTVARDLRDHRVTAPAPMIDLLLPLDGATAWADPVASEARSPTMAGLRSSPSPLRPPSPPRVAPDLDPPTYALGAPSQLEPLQTAPGYTRPAPFAAPGVTVSPGAAGLAMALKAAAGARRDQGSAGAGSRAEGTGLPALDLRIYFDVAQPLAAPEPVRLDLRVSTSPGALSSATAPAITRPAGLATTPAAFAGMARPSELPVMDFDPSIDWRAAPPRSGSPVVGVAAGIDPGADGGMAGPASTSVETSSSATGDSPAGRTRARRRARMAPGTTSGAPAENPAENPADPPADPPAGSSA